MSKEDYEQQRICREIDAARKRAARLQETDEERRDRLLRRATQTAAARLQETDEERHDRLQRKSAQTAEARLHETDEERRVRLQRNAAQTAAARLQETDEERRQRLQSNTARRLKTLHYAHFIPVEDNIQQYNVEPIDEASIPEHYAGKMDAICRHCGSKNFQQEAVNKEFSACCQKGKVKLDPITVSKYIETLLNGQHVKSKNFLEHIRSFNSSLAFASTGASMASPPGFGPYCFRIHGQIYHRAGVLHPDEGAPRKYAQLFILDDEMASRQRMSLTENAGCDPQLMTELTAYISSNNPFARATKMLYEVELEAQEAARLQNLPKMNLIRI